MIFRNICVFVLCSFMSYGQSEIHNKKDSVVIDVNNSPVFRFIHSSDTLSIKYYIVKEVDVNTNIQFKFGYSDLSKFCDSLYFATVNKPEVELNAKALYTILFDEKLAIKEIKIIKRLGYTNSGAYDYDSLVVDILKCSEKYWIKIAPQAHNNWYFYSGIFRLR